MNVLTANLLFSTLVFWIGVRIYVLPRLHELAPRTVLLPILLLHSFRQYFVLGFDSYHGKFIPQHDADHCGMMGDHWYTSTHTEIHLVPGVGPEAATSDFIGRRLIPSRGWLERFLSALTSKFKPNNFSVT